MIEESAEDKRKSQVARRQRRMYTEEQKRQLVMLFNNGKLRSEILREYDLTGSAFDRWVNRINATRSSKEKDNRTPEEEELRRLKEENLQLKMENDLLKQVTLIFAKKSL